MANGKRFLGVLIPPGALEDEYIASFCKQYLEQGVFYNLNVDRDIQQKQVKRKLFFQRQYENQQEYVKANNIPAVFFLYAHSFWKLFMDRGETKKLKMADVHDWCDSIRLMMEIDKHTLREMNQMLDHFIWMEKLPKEDKERFWYNTVDSVSGIRKHWDKIAKDFYKSEPKKEVKPIAPGF